MELCNLASTEVHGVGVRSTLLSFALLLAGCHVEAAYEPSPPPPRAAPTRAIARIEPRLPDPVREVEPVENDATDVDDPDESPEVAAEAAPTVDRDSDDLADSVDRCPDEPEDRDGFEDNDGCPDVDHDVDPVL